MFREPRTKGTSRSSGLGKRRDGCTECKRKKVRCDLRKPTCTRCLRYPRGCTYNLTIVSVKTPKTQEFDRLEAVAHQPTLKISPLFSLEEARFYMHIFSTETAIRLFPAAPRVFLRTLISTSTQTPHLFYALLAAACSHHGRLLGNSNSDSRTLSLRYTTRALSGLNSALQASTEETLTAETVATAMVLCTNDVCNGNMCIWRTHLAGAGHLLTTLLKNRRAGQDPYLGCMVKWFTTLNVLSGMSGAQARCLYNETMPWPRSSNASRAIVIDNICGYSLDLVPLLVRMSHMINGGAFDMESEEEGTSSLEAKLHSLLASPAAPEPSSLDGLSETELQSTHSAFVHSSLLHLHRRVQRFPKHDARVRSDIKNILNSIAAIHPSSSANILILWPIFSAGCETDQAEERDLIHDRMHNMKKLGMGNFTRAAELLNQYWESHTSLPWDVYFSTLGVEMVLF